MGEQPYTQSDDDTFLAGDIAAENLIVGILKLMVDKGIATENEVRLMIEERAAAANLNIEDTGWPVEETQAVEEIVALIMNRVAARFDPSYR